MKKKQIYCGICKDKTKYTANNAFTRLHLKLLHKIETKDYYDICFKKQYEGFCIVCKEKTKFLDFKNGYRECCSVKCKYKNGGRIEKAKQTKIRKYGDENYNNRDKCKQTCLEKYGVDNCLKSELIKEKSRLTKIRKYGDENYTNLDKAKQTCLEKYGVENPFQAQENIDIIQYKKRKDVVKKYTVIAIKHNCKFINHKNDDVKFKCNVCNKLFELSITVVSLKERTKSDCFCTLCNPRMPVRYRHKKMEYIINKTVEKFGVDRYRFIFGKNISTRSLMLIICNKCNHEFKKEVIVFFRGRGCPICNKKSKGERELERLLLKHGINYIEQYRFAGCFDIRPLSFDFYLPDNNILIEYQGCQHYEPVEFWGGIKGYESQKKHDKIKREYCLSENINLLEIKYTDFDKMDDILLEYIDNYKYMSNMIV